MNAINPFTTTIPALENVTEKYKFISTAQFIEDVTSLGYKLECTSQPRRGLGMHSMSFSHPNMPKLDGLDLRLLATNSHNATSAFRLYIEVGVAICSNILVSYLPELAKSARIVHRGYAIEKVANAVAVVNTHVNSVIETTALMQRTEAKNVHTFLNKASELRDAKPMHLGLLQTTRHYGQSENTAWNVFNRVQEALVKGGYATQDKLHPAYSGPRAKEITNVAARVKLNYELWALAQNTLLKDVA